MTAGTRLRVTKSILWFVVGIAAAVSVARFFGGLGAVTNLTDKTPWGLWVGFDVLGGVALAAGGFVIAAAVYILRKEHLRPLLRPAILTAFLGYAAVATGLMFDLGRPWNIWRPMFFWQHHSALFEVAWCVMLYLTVLGLEFAPVPLESSRFHKITKLLKSLTLPLVILGIMLSTLHQSSLGTLFLIAPGRVHPLWYSPILPLIFFVSAVCLGLGMVTFESRVTSWLYGRKSEDGLLRRLSLPLAGVLLLYAAIRIGDQVVRGNLGLMFTGWESALFWFEMGLSSLVPAALILFGLTKRSSAWIFVTGAMVVMGFVLHRIDVGGVSGVGITESGYFPSWGEIATSMGIVSAAILVFLFFVERFRVYEPEEIDEAGEAAAVAGPAWGRFRSPLATVRTSSFLFVAGVALAFAIIPSGSVFGARAEKTPVDSARRVLAVSTERAHPKGTVLEVRKSGTVGEDGVREVFLLDGNRDGDYALFDHDAHIDRQGKDNCAVCHHLNRPNDRETACYECHRDQYVETDIFRHAAHVEATGGNSGCKSCHESVGDPKTRQFTTACLDCHTDMIATGTRELVPVPSPGSHFDAPGYMDAMHGTCKKCHEEKDAENGAELPELSLCGTCHVEPVDLRPRKTVGEE